MSESVESNRLKLVIRMLEDGFLRPAWHGPTLRGSLRRVSAEEASWRPAPGSVNMWEIALHAAYWKYVVLRRLRGGKRGAFPRKGSNWFRRPENAEAPAPQIANEWKADLKLLDEMHAELMQLARSLGEADLDLRVNEDLSVQEFLWSIAAHDVYHAGQLQTLKQLYRARADSPDRVAVVSAVATDPDPVPA